MQDTCTFPGNAYNYTIMEIFLIGHDYRYAAEQTLLTLFPRERPVYPEAPSGGDSVTIVLRRGTKYASAACRLRLSGAVYMGGAWVTLARLTGKVETDRLLQRIVKLSFYRAALASGHPHPPWGSLTGVRPAKLMTSLLREGKTEKEALRAFREEFDVDPERAELCLAAALAAGAAKGSLAERDVCLYVGIPFCPTRCAYCSFVSVDAPRMLDRIPAYLDALERELDAVARAVRDAGLRVVSLYVGGGTPTTLSAPQLDRLLGGIAARFDPAALRESTVEAGRPDTVTAEKVAVLSRRGVTRVSVNPQTMSDAVLAAIGRKHTVADVYRAAELFRTGGTFAMNMDLIAGLPGDTPERFARTVEAVLALAPENITVHTLALKKGSRFLCEETALPDGDQVGEMLELAARQLPAAGFAPYYLYRQKYMSGSFENVGWTRPGYANLYNICIMEELTGILAAGAGGTTKLVAPGGGINRLAAPKYPKEYLERIGETCAAKQAIADFYRGGKGD